MEPNWFQLLHRVQIIPNMGLVVATNKLQIKLSVVYFIVYTPYTFI